MGRASQRKHKRRAFVRTRDVRRRTCLGCQARLDGATEVSLDVPGEDFTDMPEGAITVCAYCGTILVVEGDHFRPARSEEYEGIDLDARQVLATFPNDRKARVN